MIFTYHDQYLLCLVIRLSAFTHIVLLAMKYLIAFLGGVILTPFVGLGTSSFSRSTSTGSHYIVTRDKFFKYVDYKSSNA